MTNVKNLGYIFQDAKPFAASCGSGSLNFLLVFGNFSLSLFKPE